jgi:hypothetical protein
MIRRYFFGFVSLFSMLIATALIALPVQLTADAVLALATVAALITVAVSPPAPVRSFMERLRSRPAYIGDGSTI